MEGNKKKGGKDGSKKRKQTNESNNQDHSTKRIKDSKKNKNSKSEQKSKEEIVVMPEICWWKKETGEKLSENRSNSRGRELLGNLFRIGNMDAFESEIWQKKPYLNQLNEIEREKVFSDLSHPMQMISMKDIKNLLKRYLLLYYSLSIIIIIIIIFLIYCILFI